MCKITEKHKDHENKIENIDNLEKIIFNTEMIDLFISEFNYKISQITNCYSQL